MPGIKDIYRMTKPLGYALGGPAGMTEPERKSAQPVTMAQIMRDAEASKAPTPPIGLRKLEANLFTQDPMNQLIDKGKEELKELGRGIQGLGSKSLGAIKYAVEELIGAGPAEGSESYISPGEAKDMSTEDLEKEIHGFNPYEFGGQGYSWKNLRTIQIVIDELMSRLGDD